VKSRIGDICERITFGSVGKKRNERKNDEIYYLMPQVSTSIVFFSVNARCFRGRFFIFCNAYL